MTQDRLALLLAFFEEDPSDAFTQFAIAQEYLKRGEAAQALAFFERLASEQPDYTGTYYHLGKLYERLQRKEEAVATYQRGIEAARGQRNLKDLSELQDALMTAQGIGFEEDEG